MVFLPNTNIMTVISCIKFENIKQIITTCFSIIVNSAIYPGDIPYYLR